MALIALVSDTGLTFNVTDSENVLSSYVTVTVTSDVSAIRLPAAVKSEADVSVSVSVSDAAVATLLSDVSELFA